MHEQPKVFIGIPLLREFENIELLLNNLKSQTFPDFRVVICVNQPEGWWNDSEKESDCIDNKKTLARLAEERSLDLSIIDKSSKGNGWHGKEKGVGWARKLIFEKILGEAKNGDIIISLDADTDFSERYIQSIVRQFSENPTADAIAVPYYHRLGNNAELNRMILYYEIYMRYYLLNLLRIESPFAFTALGSAIAFRAETYKKIGGITPVEAGEDFYLVQKICKKSRLLLWNPECVYPSARTSDRVPFGTGQAVNKPIGKSLDLYPLYKKEFFDKIKDSYLLFASLFEAETDTPISAFLKKQLKTEDLWEPLRRNFKTKEQFIRACHERFDGLRILQFLKANQPHDFSNEREIQQYLLQEYHHRVEDFSFEDCPLEFLSSLRDFLFEKEAAARRNHDK